MRLKASLLTSLLLIVPSTSFADQITLTADKDSFLRHGAPNTNEGANKRLNIRKVGRRRALVHFDLSTVNAEIPAGQEITSASLNLYVTFNNKLWTKSGRTIGAHLLLADWEEGTGSNAKSPRVNQAEPETGEERDEAKNRGTGAGTTWHCAKDSNTTNKKPDCKSKWKGSSFKSPATGILKITNKTLGEISLDVTEDVSALLDGTFENHGWLVKKVQQDKVGSIWVNSRESSTHKPTLVIETGYAFDLTGAEEVPAVTTNATGRCSVSISNDHTKATVICSHKARRVTMAHIHDGPVGADGPVVCDLAASGSSTPIVKTCELTADLYTKLTTGALYVNVHTMSNPGGELRGQIR